MIVKSSEERVGFMLFAKKTQNTNKDKGRQNDKPLINIVLIIRIRKLAPFK